MPSRDARRARGRQRALVERHKVVSARGRLLRRIDDWEELRDAYTRMCADRGHELARSVAPRLDERLDLHP